MAIWRAEPCVRRPCAHCVRKSWKALSIFCSLVGFYRVGYEQELCFVYENLYSVRAPMDKDCWRPPDYNIFKLNFDASFIQGQKFATTTILARDYKGEVVGADNYLYEEVVDAFVAEARACEKALLFAHVTYNFVPREVNGAAHALALEGRRRRVCGNWVDGVLDSVRSSCKAVLTPGCMMVMLKMRRATLADIECCLGAIAGS
ncbi:hypothetical protein GOBAR_DD23341 [Gossypium barbadense]|nr:hypothetical protein GOBAR_DD23341 [Gossypium barbadense]